MKRIEGSSPLSEDEGGIFGRDHRDKRARTAIPPSSPLSRLNSLSHDHTDGGSGGPSDYPLTDLQRRSIPQTREGASRPRAQSDPPSKASENEMACGSFQSAISDLSKKAAELSKKQQQHMLAAERLQERLTRGEHALGEHLRESLKIQRAIQQRRDQNKIDKQELELERAQSRSVADDLDRVLSEIRVLAGRT